MGHVLRIRIVVCNKDGVAYSQIREFCACPLIYIEALRMHGCVHARTVCRSQFDFSGLSGAFEGGSDGLIVSIEEGALPVLNYKGPGEYLHIPPFSNRPVYA